MNTTFQRSNEQAPVYELTPIHTLATTVQKNILNMNVQSSLGFDPFSTSFIKHAEKTIQDDRGKRFFFWWGLLHGPQQGPDRMKGKKTYKTGKRKTLLPKQKNPP